MVGKTAMTQFMLQQLLYTQQVVAVKTQMSEKERKRTVTDDVSL